MENKNKMGILFSFTVRGTRLRALFLFLSGIIQDKITTLHLSKTQIICNELSSNKRILFEYNLESKNLVNYQYNYTDQDVTKIRFELKWLNEKLQEVKIKNHITFSISEEEPDFLSVDIDNQKAKKIKLSLAPEMKIQVPPSNIYYEQPITMNKEDFLPFLKIKPTTKEGKQVREEIEIKIQSPNFLKFTRVSDTSETEKYGTFKKDKAVFKETFYINEIKHIFKLHTSTAIFNIYQPKEEKMPLCIGGNCSESGTWRIFIHCSSVKPK